MLLLEYLKLILHDLFNRKKSYSKVILKAKYDLVIGILEDFKCE